MNVIVNKITPVLFIVALCTQPSASQAQRQLDVKVEVPPVLINDLADSHPVSSLLNEQTVMVAEIDWKKIDVKELSRTIQQLTGDRPSDDEIMMRIQGVLRKTGAGMIYLVADMQSIAEGGPLAMIPAEQPKALQAAFNEIAPSVASLSADQAAVLLAPQKVVQRFGNTKPSPRVDLISPLRDAQRLDHTAVLAIPAKARQILQKLIPVSDATDTSPEFPGSILLDLQRVTFTARTPPNTLLRVAVDTPSEQAAKRVAEAVQTYAQSNPQTRTVSINRDSMRVLIEADQQAFDHAKQLALAARNQTRRQRLVQSMRQLGVAFYNYAEYEQHLPPRCFVDPKGKPLHSWMVAVLPHFEQQALYNNIDLSKPWNASENKHLANLTPAGIGDSALPVAHTVIRAPVFPGSLWHGDGPPKQLTEITDHPGNTIMLAEAPNQQSTHWADPQAWEISESDPVGDLLGDRDGLTALMADGAVRYFSREELTKEKIKALLTIAGGD